MDKAVVGVAWENCEIFVSIVRLYSINVMNNRTFWEISAQCGLRNENMLLYIAAAISMGVIGLADHDVPVFIEFVFPHGMLIP